MHHACDPPQAHIHEQTIHSELSRYDILKQELAYGHCSPVKIWNNPKQIATEMIPLAFDLEELPKQHIKSTLKFEWWISA